MSHFFLQSEAGIEKINISHNIVMKLPKSISLMANSLTFLKINDNRLTNFPPELCSLVKLWFLDITNNGIKSLPDNMGSLTRFENSSFFFFFSFCLLLLL